MTPEEVLAEARTLASRGVGELGGTASRAAALLGRSALEDAIWDLFPQLKEVSGRAMHLTLPFVFDRQVARQAALVWGRLSAASHHHIYEMPPTAVELERMLDTVHDVIDAVRDRQERRREKRSAGVTRASGR
ncbi:hypothetical protein [Euzebya sp.]|uniref:hypothetical protein n=1 Tax=Euzebya sp. TaxID=1971409 RepID=UPI003512A958